MLIGSVLGSVVASQKDQQLESTKLLVVQIHDHNNSATDKYVVAVDTVQAGPGDMVLFATGSSARQTTLTQDKPCDAVIMAIIDSWDVDGRDIFNRRN